MTSVPVSPLRQLYFLLAKMHIAIECSHDKDWAYNASLMKIHWFEAMDCLLPMIDDPAVKLLAEKHAPNYYALFSQNPETIKHEASLQCVNMLRVLITAKSPLMTDRKSVV